jgi:hypothetical protein
MHRVHNPLVSDSSRVSFLLAYYFLSSLDTDLGQHPAVYFRRQGRALTRRSVSRRAQVTGPQWQNITATSEVNKYDFSTSYHKRTWHPSSNN